MIFYTLSALTIAVFELCLAKDLSLPVTTCKRDASDYSTCLVNAMTESWPNFVKGLPEFDFPILEPLKYGNQTEAFDAGEIHGKITVTDTLFYGLKDMQVKKIKAHFLDNAFRLQLENFFPHVYVEGFSYTEGRLANFKMGGKGYFNITMGGVTSMWDITGPVINDRWTIKHFTAIPSIKTLKMYFSGIFESKELNDIVIDFVNEFWPSLSRVVIPIAAETWGVWLTDHSNRLFSNVPFSEVFP